MYISLFTCGVLATIGVEVSIFILYVIYIAIKTNIQRKKKNND